MREALAEAAAPGPARDEVPVGAVVLDGHLAARPAGDRRFRQRLPHRRLEGRAETGAHARLPPERLVQGPVQGVAEPELAGDDGERLVGKQVQVSGEHPQIHLVDAKVGEDGQVASG